MPTIFHALSPLSPPLPPSAGNWWGVKEAYKSDWWNAEYSPECMPAFFTHFHPFHPPPFFPGNWWGVKEAYKSDWWNAEYSPLSIKFWDALDFIGVDAVGFSSPFSLMPSRFPYAEVSPPCPRIGVDAMGPL